MIIPARPRQRSPDRTPEHANRTSRRLWTEAELVNLLQAGTMESSALAGRSAGAIAFVRVSIHTYNATGSNHSLSATLRRYLDAHRGTLHCPHCEAPI